MGVEKAQRQFWGRFWQKGQAWGEWDEVSQAQYDALKALFPEPASLRVLEAGSGTGRARCAWRRKGRK
jgi:hypothetical protein